MPACVRISGFGVAASTCVVAGGVVVAAQPTVVIAETSKLLASDGSAGDTLGRSISIEGRRVVVGAPFESRGFFEREAGAAYVFDAVTGQQVRKLTAFDAETDAFFGVSVAAIEDRVLVGASQAEAAGFRAGAAYAFDGPAVGFTTQVLPVSILPQGPDAGFFGLDLDADSGFTVIAAPADLDVTNGGGGAMYIYETATLDLVAKVFSSDQSFADNFGTKVAVSGSFAVGTTPFDDDLGPDSGSAYVFDAATGAELRKILAPDGAERDFFGLSVALDGDLLAVGAPLDDDAGASSGSVYLFDVRTGAFQRKLVASDARAGDRFGFAVAIANGRVIVGAPNVDTPGDDAGAVYVYDADLGAALARLVPTDLGPGAVFGGAVSASGDLIAVSAEGDDTNGAEAGAAYVFDLAGLAAGCSVADLATPFGLIDIGDVDAFIAAFVSGAGAADVAPPFGLVDIDDVDGFIVAFLAGCP